jgi:predicted PurR-regulated permease PerM
MKIENIIVNNIKRAKYEPNTNFLNRTYVILTDVKTGGIIALAGKKVINNSVYDISTENINMSYTVGSVVKGASHIVGYNTNALKIGEVRNGECIKIKGTPKKCSFMYLGYLNDLTAILDKSMKDLNISQEYFQMAVNQLNDFVNYVIKIAADLIPILGSILKTVASSVWNIIIGIIVSVYILIDKENFCALGRKVVFSMFNEKHANKTLELVHRSNDTFGKFLIGKIIDSAIIGVLTFAILTVFKMPYTLLISVIIGITNIIPFFGPFFGAIPSAIIILFVSPVKALIFLVLILVIQQIDGNIIGPKILGDSIGISAFWILFSLLVAGKFMGLVGMIIGVPLFAIVYSIIKEIVEAKLANKGLPTETKDYMNK